MPEERKSPEFVRIEHLLNRLKLEASIFSDKLDLLKNLARTEKANEWTPSHEEILKALEKS